jgi:inner membrane protein
METTTFNNRFRNSISLKLAVIAMLSLMLLIPTLFVRSLINERQDRRNQTILEVTSKWGSQQTVTGPILIVPYERYEETAKNEFISRTYYMHILPDNLEIAGIIDPEIRYRGIYKVLTYRSDLELKAIFTKASLESWPVTPDKIYWDQAVVVMGISDQKGIHKIKTITWNNDSIAPEGGMPNESSIRNGINAPARLNLNADNLFKMKIDLNGSEALHIVPVGKKSHVTLRSAWQTPSFDGSVIPDKREINNKGFAAEWNTLFLNRAYPQKWSDRNYGDEISQSAFGVSLLVPVDIYLKTTRSVKYALLFIGLTFLVLFFTEVMSRRRIHIVQYLLTGAALVIFYSLLLALSEQLVFGIAYLIAAISTIGLIVSYTHSLLRKTGYTIAMAGVLVSLYGFLYVILNLSDLALLLGNIGLFIILAFVMFFSRKIDWFNVQNDKTAGS